MATQIFVYDEIGDPSWGLVGAKTIAAELADIGPTEDLLVRINSPGGSVFEALAIRQLLQDHAGAKTFRIDALAASAATFLPTDGATVEINPHGRFMIHSPWTMAMGNAASLREMADQLDGIEDTLLDIYEARTGEATPRADIQAMLAAETLMTANEAIQAGFVDSVAEQAQNIAACWRPGMFSAEMDAIFAGEPTTQERTKAREQKAQLKVHRGPTAADRERLERMNSPRFRDILRGKSNG